MGYESDRAGSDRALAEAEKRVVVLLQSLGDVLPAAKIARIDGSPGHRAYGPVFLQLDEAFGEGSYAELLLRLSELGMSDRHLYLAVRGRYLEARRRMLTLTVRKHRWGRKLEVPARVEVVSGLAGLTGTSATVLCRVWSDDVDEAAAAEGVSWLARAMYAGCYQNILVPREMMVLVA